MEESPYHIYGKLPLPTRNHNIRYVPTSRMSIGDWD